MGAGTMAMVMDDQGAPKYYCRICKKGFGCGQALGGHMRAHGINDDLITAVQTEADDSDFSPSKGECKRTYSLRSNPSRQRTCRVCESCGKEFSSWKSFLEHGKCTSEVEDFGAGGGESSVMFDSPQCHQEEEEEDDDDDDEDEEEDDDDDNDNDNDVCGRGWIKGKRTKRCKLVGGSSEEDDLAASCLVMLSAARVEPSTVVVMETEESCASASREEERKMKLVAAMPTTTTMMATTTTTTTTATAMTTTSKGGFECKACKRVFNSHQALGGHRASHKKVKGCFAAKLDSSTTAATTSTTNMPPSIPTTTTTAAADLTTGLAIVPFDSNAPLAVTPLRKKPKLHECTICHRIFTSGQALGGHKRCHWLTSTSATPLPPNSASISNLQHLTMFEKPPIDLNMPVTMDMGGGTLTLDLAATALCLQTLNNDNDDEDDHNHNSSNNNNNNNNHQNTTQNRNTKLKGDVDGDMEDEVESKVKLAKLSELKDVVGSGGEWLKVGIGSNPNLGNINDP